MLFSSPSFLFLFLPLGLLTYFSARLLTSKLENIVLLFWSTIFYASGELRFLPLLGLSILANYLLGLALGADIAPRRRQIVFGLGVVLNLGTLAVFKYTGFFVRNLNVVLVWLGVGHPVTDPKITLPLGISFFTFHALSYLFDIERKRLPAQRNFPTFALYILLFPQLVAGPIIRYHDIAAALEKRTVTLDGFAKSVTRFSYGFAKKMLVANTLGVLADQLFARSVLSLPGAWLAGTVYALQIFFDFSGYTDMAIGLGGMFGFPFPENFNFPFIARSISEYWQRWHMSLTNWLKDYLYTPLALAVARRLSWALPSAIVITMTLSGLWHGAAWNFVLWGFFFGAIMACEQEFLGRQLKRLPIVVRHLYTLIIVVISFVLFRAESATKCFAMLRSMFDLRRAATFPELELINHSQALVLGLAVLFSMPVSKIAATTWSRLGWKSGETVAVWATTGVAFFMFLLSSAHAAASTYNPFIYFRF